MSQPISGEPRRVRRRLGLALTMAALVLALVGSFDWIDRPAAGYYESAFQRALVTFAIARTLNGVISAIQGTEVSIEPAGVGVTLTPGEIIDPINDLIERFSWLMVLSTTSLGVQKILMDISQWWGVRILLIGSTAFYLWARLGPVASPTRRWANRLLAGMLIVRFVMPVMVVLNHGVYEIFMRDDVQKATAAVENTTESIQTMAQEDERGSPDEGLLASAQRWFDDTLSQMNVRQRMSDYADRLGSTTEHLLRLAAVFVFQTVVAPLLFLWVLTRGISRVFAGGR